MAIAVVVGEPYQENILENITNQRIEKGDREMDTNQLVGGTMSKTGHSGSSSEDISFQYERNV